MPLSPAIPGRPRIHTIQTSSQAAQSLVLCAFSLLTQPPSLLPSRPSHCKPSVPYCRVNRLLTPSCHAEHFLYCLAYWKSVHLLSHFFLLVALSRAIFPHAIAHISLPNSIFHSSKACVLPSFHSPVHFSNRYFPVLTFTRYVCHLRFVLFNLSSTPPKTINY